MQRDAILKIAQHLVFVVWAAALGVRLYLLLNDRPQNPVFNIAGITALLVWLSLRWLRRKPPSTGTRSITD